MFKDQCEHGAEWFSFMTIKPSVLSSSAKWWMMGNYILTFHWTPALPSTARPLLDPSVLCYLCFSPLFQSWSAGPISTSGSFPLSSGPRWCVSSWSQCWPTCSSKTAADKATSGSELEILIHPRETFIGSYCHRQLSDVFSVTCIWLFKFHKMCVMITHRGQISPEMPKVIVKCIYLTIISSTYNIKKCFTSSL